MFFKDRKFSLLYSGESLCGFLKRLQRSVACRLRGKIYAFLGFFAANSSSKIDLGHSCRFRNSRNILLRGSFGLGICGRIEVHHTLEFPPHRNKIIFGNRTSFGDYFHCAAINLIIVGDNVLGGSNILITDHSHGVPSLDIASSISISPRDRPLTSKGPIEIGDNVWIGDGVVILSGVKIGSNSIIGANSVVTKSLPSNSIFISTRCKY